MKKSFLCCLGFILASSLFASTPAGFTDDLDAAIAEAKNDGKAILAVFSGSDWCYWCQVLEKEYLSKPEFVNEAQKTMKLVFIDSPRDKSKLSESAKANNPKITKKYKVRGFPTLKFIATDGSAEDAPRPEQGVSPEAYAQTLARVVKTRPLVDFYFAKFNKAAADAMNEYMAPLEKLRNALSDGTMDDLYSTFEALQKSCKDVKEKIATIKKDVEELTIPSDIEKEKEEVIRVLTKHLSGLERTEKMTIDEVKALKKK